jgi:hypothetical protein
MAAEFDATAEFTAATEADVISYDHLFSAIMGYIDGEIENGRVDGGQREFISKECEKLVTAGIKQKFKSIIAPDLFGALIAEIGEILLINYPQIILHKNPHVMDISRVVEILANVENCFKEASEAHGWARKIAHEAIEEFRVALHARIGNIQRFEIIIPYGVFNSTAEFVSGLLETYAARGKLNPADPYTRVFAQKLTEKMLNYNISSWAGEK